MIREAITGPTPGIIFNSFSVAVLMSILPGSIFSFACDFLGSTGLLTGVGGLGIGVAGIGVAEFAGGVTRDPGFFPGTKTLKGAGFCACAFSRPASTPQPPIFSCLASPSN